MKNLKQIIPKLFFLVILTTLVVANVLANSENEAKFIRKEKF